LVTAIDEGPNNQPTSHVKVACMLNSKDKAWKPNTITNGSRLYPPQSHFGQHSLPPLHHQNHQTHHVSPGPNLQGDFHPCPHLDAY